MPQLIKLCFAQLLMLNTAAQEGKELSKQSEGLARGQ